jgi:ELWxxDGT repeat protein
MFAADDGTHGRELFRSNGVGLGSGTVLFKDIYPGSYGSNPAYLTNVNGTLYFEAWSPRIFGGLWQSNGATSGTFPVDSKIDTQPSQMLTNVNGTLFFAGFGQLWVLSQSGTASASGADSLSALNTAISNTAGQATPLRAVFGEEDGGSMVPSSAANGASDEVSKPAETGAPAPTRLVRRSGVKDHDQLPASVWDDL